MTQKQLIDQFCKFRGKCTTDDVVALNFAYKMLAPQWISVEDELPKENDYYLCVIGSTQEVLWYNEGIEEWYEVYATKEAYLDIEDLTARVTHWMPLPSVEHLKDK